MQAGGFAEFNPSYMPGGTPMTAPAGFGSQSVAEARADRASRRAKARHEARPSRWERAVVQMNARGLGDANASVAPAAAVASNATLTPAGGAMASGYGSSGIVS